MLLMTLRFAHLMPRRKLQFPGQFVATSRLTTGKGGSIVRGHFIAREDCPSKMPYKPREMFSPDRVIDLTSETKEGVIRELVDALAASENVTDRRDLLDKILEREKTMSTGVGVGLALPHVKIRSIKDFAIAIGRHKKGVDFQSIDKKPAHIIIMIGCHESQSADYMKVLSKLVRALREQEFQRDVMLAETPQKVVELFLGPGGVFAG